MGIFGWLAKEKSQQLHKTAYQWTEEDPKIEVARRKLEQGGTALFDREQQHAMSSQVYVPPRARLQRALKTNWLLFRYRGYVFNHTSSAARAWEWTVGWMALVLVVFLPVYIAFEGTFGDLHNLGNYLFSAVDAVYAIDIAVRFR